MHRVNRSLSASLLALLGLLLSACASKPIAAPTGVSHVTDLDGRPANPLASSTRRATVLLFITHDCPISNAYAPEIHRLCDVYTRQGIAFYLVYSDPDLSAADAAQHYRDYAYQCPAMLDPSHELAKRAGATVTPEAAVFLADGRMIYRGRIDDLYMDYGKARLVATTHDLKDVLEIIARNGALSERTTRAVGCPIPI